VDENLDKISGCADACQRRAEGGVRTSERKMMGKGGGWLVSWLKTKNLSIHLT
jgi:hypothetical protein